MPRKKNDIEEILSLPHTKLIGGKPYVRIVYHDSAGKQREKTKRVNTVAEAISAIEQIRQELGNHGPGAFDGDKMTFDELVREYKKGKSIPKWYEDPLVDHFGPRRIKSITYGDIQQFKAAREAVPRKGTEEKRSPTTINRELEWLRTILLYAIRHEWLARNPFTKGPAPLIKKSEEAARSRIPTPEEEAAILAQCVDQRKHLRAILIAAKDTGLRKSALLSLTWSAVDFEKGFLRIPKGNKYKKRPETIGMTARLREELLILWEESDKKDSPIFGIDDCKRAYATACKKAKVFGLRFHDWRHGFATDLMEAGVEERLAMRAAGHVNPETHAIYTNVDERLARLIADHLDQLHSRREGNAPTTTDLIN